MNPQAPRARIAVIVKGWPRISETFVAQELVALEAAGFELDVWSLRRTKDTKTHPLHDKLAAPVYQMPQYLLEARWRVLCSLVHVVFRRRFLRAAWAFLKDFRRAPGAKRIRRFGQACMLVADLPDDIQAFYAHFMHTPASVARYASILTGLPWGISAHARDIWTSPEWDLRDKLTEATYGADFLATCTSYGASYLRGLADREDRVELIYHGLDLERFPAAPERQAKSGPLRLMSVGRTVEKKGFDRLIAALALLPDDLDWHWEHIGHGPLSNQLSAAAEAAGVSSRITWRGVCDQPDVIKSMCSADVFILPSRIASDGDRDGLPNVLMEAASQKLAILSTTVSAIPEFITSGEHGLLAPDEPEAIAEAIVTLANSPQQRLEMGEAAYKRLTDDFLMQPGIEQLCRRLDAIC